MKTLAATAALLLALVALASGQNDGNECHCGMFMTYYSDEVEVHRLPAFNVDSCVAVPICKSMCAKAYRDFTNNGDLNYVLSSGYTVGQESCIVLANRGYDSIHHETIYGYARLCDGPWDYDGETSVNELCCDAGHNTPC